MVVVGDVTAGRGAPRGGARRSAPGQARGPRRRSTCRHRPPSGPSQARVPDESSLQDSVMLAETVGLPVDSPDRYTLMLGNIDPRRRLLLAAVPRPAGEDRLRLHREAARWTGRAPAPTTRSPSAPTPQNVAKARAAGGARHRGHAGGPGQRRRAGARQGAGAAPPADAARQRAGDRRRSTCAWPSWACRSTASRSPGERYLAITAPEIQRAFATGLRPDDLAQVVKGPPTAAQ